MSIREIIKRGDPVLGKHCHPVTRFDRKLWNLLDDMKDTLAEAHGLGLAAPQVGILRRVVVISDLEGGMTEMVNPEIIERSEEEESALEGCLSVPGLWGYVSRPVRVKAQYQDRNGELMEVEGEGLAARCICHELAHLDGHLYTELADRLYTTEELDAMEEAAEKQAAGDEEEDQTAGDEEDQG